LPTFGNQMAWQNSEGEAYGNRDRAASPFAKASGDTPERTNK